MITIASAAACESTGQASAHTPTPSSAENLASAGHLPPDVLDDIERRHRERYSFQLVYRIRAERDYRAWPSPHEVALRLSGKFPGGIQLHLPFAQHAVTTIQNRPPDKQPSRQKGSLAPTQRPQGCPCALGTHRYRQVGARRCDHRRTRRRPAPHHRRRPVWD